jgi:two-component system LytT family response regulator
MSKIPVKTFNCIIADDDEIDRLTTLSFAKFYPFLQITGCFASAEETLEQVKTSKPDVLLLDIEMPGMSGLELRQQLIDVPACIFITSYPDFAVESFEMSVLDFLIKPLKADRFEKAMRRLEDYLLIKQKAELLDLTLGADTLFIKDGHDHIKIQLHEVLYLEALKDYTSIVTAKRKYCVLSSLGNLLTEKTFRAFVRIHRSYAVQKHYVKKITSREVMVNDILLPVGRTYRDSLELFK